MQSENCTHVFPALGVSKDLLIIGIHEVCQYESLDTYRRLDAVRYVSLVGLRIEIAHIFTRVCLMCHKVVVGTRCHAPDLAPAEREQILDVCGSVAVMREFLRSMVSESCVFRFQTQILEEVEAVFLPVSEPVQFCARLAEEFKFHLLKLSYSEDKVARCDLVSERFSYLGDTERYLLAGSSLNILEVDKDSLCSFRSHVDL